MLTRFEKKAMALLLSILMAGLTVFVPGVAVNAEETADKEVEIAAEAEPTGDGEAAEEVTDEAEVFTDGIWYYYELEDGTVATLGYDGTDKNVEIPSELDGKTVTKVGWGAFMYDENVENIVIPETVTDIQYAAFFRCNNLKSVTLPKGLKSIEYEAFEDCGKLEGVALPDGLEKIGAYAFLGCDTAKEIVVPKSVTKIEDYALGFSSVSGENSGDGQFEVTEVKWIDGFKLFGYPDTAAQKYADNFHVDFVIIYPDVNKGDWYYDDVNWAGTMGLMTGYKNGIFGPADNLTRGQFAIILHRFEGEPEVTGKSPFPDVADDLYYTNAIIWAKENKVVGGYENGNFGPDDYMNREQLATMMFRYASSAGYDTSKKADLNTFPDADKVNEFAKEAMQWAVAEKLITGDQGNLNPQGTANRAVTAAIMKRFAEAYF